MTARAARRLSVYVPMLTLGALLALGPATAARAAGATQMQYGWWTEANYVPGQDTPGTNSTPDVNDMHVAIGPVVFDDPNSLQNDNKVGAVEVSAVRFQLSQAVPYDIDPGTPVANIKLTLDPAFAPVGTPVILACKPLDTWQPALAGNWSQRVYYQSGCSVGASNDGGKSYEFTVLASQLSRGGSYVDMAIAPTLDPNAQPFKIWFNAPTLADLTILPIVASSADTFAVPQDTSAQTAPAATGGYPSTPFNSVVAAAPPLLPAPPSAAPAAPNAPAVTTPAATSAAVTPVVVDTAARVAAGILLIAVLLAVMSAVGIDLQRLLTPAGQVAGVGRFRRARSGSPLPL